MAAKNFMYQQVYQTIKDRILARQYVFGSVLPSERALSDEFGVWRTTIRQALELLAEEKLIEKKPGVGNRVCYGQEDIPEEPEQDNVIGFFISSDIASSLQQEQPYYSDLLYYLDAECRENGCHFIFSTINNRADVERLMQNHYILVVYLSHTNFEHLETIGKYNVPTVLLNEKYMDYPIIANDQLSAGYLAVNHLMEMGHRKIGIITGPMNHLTVRRRLAGCYLALNDYHVPAPTGKWMQEGDWEFEGGYNCAKDMFSSPDRQGLPTAVVAFNDIMGIGAMRALRDMGYEIPNDISVIGSDNIRQLAYTEPTLTTIDMKTQYTAKAIVISALNRIYTNLASGSNIITPVELVVRNSVSRLPTPCGPASTEKVAP